MESNRYNCLACGRERPKSIKQCRCGHIPRRAGCECDYCIQSHFCPMCGNVHRPCDDHVMLAHNHMETIAILFKPSTAKAIIPCFHTRLSMVALWQLQCCGAIILAGRFQGGDMFSWDDVCYNEDCRFVGQMVHYSFLEYACAECYLGNLPDNEACRIIIKEEREVTARWKELHGN